jgi:hypothetical protein
VGRGGHGNRSDGGLVSSFMAHITSKKPQARLDSGPDKTRGGSVMENGRACMEPEQGERPRSTCPLAARQRFLPSNPLI